MKRAFIILIFLAFYSISNAQIQYKFNHFTTDDGLPTNSIYCITEDKNGTIILGTDNGLTFFDGNDFKTLNVKDGLINPYIVAVTKDEKDILWFINYGGKLQKFVNNTIITTPFLTQQTNSILNTDSKIYVYTTQNRYSNKSYYYQVINKKNGNVYKSKITNITSKFAAPVFCQNNKEIRIINNNLIFENHKIAIPKDVSLLHKVIFRKNNVCLLDENYLFILDFNGSVLNKIKLPNSLSRNPVYKYDFITDKQENCWLNIQNKGLFILKSDNWMTISENLGLNTADNINFIYNDSAGKIWIATNEKGLFCIPNIDIQFIKFPNENNYFNGFAYSLDKNSLFFSSKFNLYSLDKKNNIKPIKRSKEEIKIDNFNSIPVFYTNNMNPPTWDKNIQMLIVQGRGLLQYEAPISYTLYGRNSLRYYNNQVAMQSESPIQEKIRRVILYKNEYYFSNSEKINIRTFNEKEIKIKRELKLKIKGFIQDFAFIKDTMWIATEGKVYKAFNEKIVDSISFINNIPIENINRIKTINDAIYLWNMNGLFVLSPKGNRVLNKNNFLPSNDVYNVTQFDHQLLVATKDGLAKINTDLILKKSKKPAFNILYKAKVESSIKISSDEELVKLEFKIQNFEAAKNQIIQYKIDHLNWITTQNLFVNFQSLSYGKHSVFVRVRDVNSDWTSQNISIKKAFPFYLKWWFIVLAILVVSGLIYLIYRYQIAKIKRKKLQEIATNNKVAELRQSALSAMMNPHFVFNSLNAIQYFVNSNQKEKSSEHLGKLARLVRLFLSHASEPFIRLEDEIKRLEIYLELEKVRFNNFDFTFNIEDKIDVHQTKIPNMIVQPFIENAILHGVSHLKENDGKIDLNFHLKKDILTIEVIDNGFGIDTNKSKNTSHVSKGITIINERIEILQQSYPEKVFSITQQDAFPDAIRKGHKVVIVVTILK
ncbi:MAG: histidine kinase [Flavobacteriaceae bacterium]|nr:histidine kinase [Flavobacteriaceae bacterium]